MSVPVVSGNGGEGGGPSGSQMLGGLPSVTQPPTAGVAGGVVTDVGVRACQALESPEVPHLPVPEPDCTARGVFWVVPNSPLHSALRFNHFTPNPSAPSPSAPSPSAASPPSPLNSQTCSAAAVFCVVCGAECGAGEQSYGKCQDCLDAAFHAFAAVHTPNLVQHFLNSSPSLEGTVALTDNSATSASSRPISPKRARRLSPPHRKAGPPK